MVFKNLYLGTLHHKRSYKEKNKNTAMQANILPHS